MKEWIAGHKHPEDLVRSRHVTVSLQPVDNVFHATLIGDRGVFEKLTVTSSHLAGFLATLQTHWQTSGGSLVIGWGLVATGGIGPRPGGPPGPTGEPPVVAAWNLNLHYGFAALADMANGAKLG